MRPWLFLFAIAISGCSSAGDKPIESFRAPEIAFVAEQSGAFEDKVKSALTSVLSSHPEIKRAYLAAVIYNGTEQSVALCLDAPRSDKGVLNDIQAAFRKLAGPDAHLDIIFLAGEQSSKVAAVARAFYVAP